MKYDPVKDPTNPWFKPWYQRFYDATPTWVFFLIAGVLYFLGNGFLIYAICK